MTVQRASCSLGGHEHRASGTKADLWRDEGVCHTGGLVGVNCRICCHKDSERDEIESELGEGHLRYCVNVKENLRSMMMDEAVRMDGLWTRNTRRCRRNVNESDESECGVCRSRKQKSYIVETHTDKGARAPSC